MPRDDAFYFADGSFAENTSQLAERLKSVDPNMVSHHITSDNNDFANWMRIVIGDEDLARKLEKCRSLPQVIDTLDAKIHHKPAAPRYSPEPRHEPPQHVHQPQQHHPEPPVTHDQPPMVPQENTFPQQLIDRAIEEKREKTHIRDFVLGGIAGIILTVIVYQFIQLL